MVIDSGYVETFQRRVPQAPIAPAPASYWLRRAETLEAARPALGEYFGGAVVWEGDPLPAGAVTTEAPVEELRARWVDLTETALACRRHADLMKADLPADWADEIADVLGEAA